MPSIDAARNWYPGSDPVHGFDHVLRVVRLAERLARAEGADLEIVHAAVLLHDAQDPAAGDEAAEMLNEVERADHHQASARFARRALQAEGWTEERIAAVEHCIRAHRFRDDTEQPRTLEAMIVFDADKLDAIGATGVARAVAYAVSHGQPVYAEPSERFMQTGQTEADEPHSAYHEYLFKLIRLKDRLYTASARSLAAGRHSLMVEFFVRLKEEYSGQA